MHFRTDPSVCVLTSGDARVGLDRIVLLTPVGACGSADGDEVEEPGWFGQLQGDLAVRGWRG
jgi:hypothetical protein